MHLLHKITLLCDKVLPWNLLGSQFCVIYLETASDLPSEWTKQALAALWWSSMNYWKQWNWYAEDSRISCNARWDIRSALYHNTIHLKHSDITNFSYRKQQVSSVIVKHSSNRYATVRYRKSVKKQRMNGNGCWHGNWVYLEHENWLLQQDNQERGLNYIIIRPLRIPKYHWLKPCHVGVSTCHDVSPIFNLTGP
jgi:hypothetical protein